jgi:hypothetical protein
MVLVTMDLGLPKVMILTGGGTMDVETTAHMVLVLDVMNILDKKPPVAL